VAGITPGGSSLWITAIDKRHTESCPLEGEGTGGAHDPAAYDNYATAEL